MIVISQRSSADVVNCNLGLRSVVCPMVGIKKTLKLVFLFERSLEFELDSDWRHLPDINWFVSLVVTYATCYTYYIWYITICLSMTYSVLLRHSLPQHLPHDKLLHQSKSGTSGLYTCVYVRLPITLSITKHQLF